jgi:quercetin dioxygenase-like cupin family protein
MIMDRAVENARLGVFREADDSSPVRGDPAKFIGDVRVHSVSEHLGTEQTRIRLVRFTSGARTRPHRHTKDQLLYFIDGPGIVAVDGREDQRIEANEFVMLPAGVVHMHGATDDAPTSHISMMVSIDSDFDTGIPHSWQRYRATGQ